MTCIKRPLPSSISSRCMSSPASGSKTNQYDLPLSRQLTELRRRKVVTIHSKRHVVIPDTERLRRHAG